MAASPRRVNCSRSDIPLDFSYLDITSVSEVLQEEPRDQCSKKVPKIIVQVPVEETEGEEKDSNKQEVKELVQYKSSVLWLRNNHLQDLSGCMEALNDLLVAPLELRWIDLSVNELTIIHPCLCDLPNLFTLNLHGNHIADITEVDKLGGLTNLRKLTLHGNPIDTTKGYRWYVISKIPQLTHLDTTGITKADRATAASYKFVKPQKKKKKSTD